MAEEPSTALLDDPKRKQMGEAILLQEKFAYHLHNSQRMEELERAPLHERVASILSTMNRSLSVVDEGREVAIAMHTQDLLRNSRVKAELAHFLVLQAQIQRMASLSHITGRVDELIVALLQEDDKLSPNQLLALQRSAHTQLAELTAYVKDARTDGLEGLIKTILPDSNKEIATTIQTIAKLDAKGRERVNTLIRTILTKAAESPSPDAPAIDVKP